MPLAARREVAVPQSVGGEAVSKVVKNVFGGFDCISCIAVANRDGITVNVTRHTGDMSDLLDNTDFRRLTWDEIGTRDADDVILSVANEIAGRLLVNA